MKAIGYAALVTICLGASGAVAQVTTSPARDQPTAADTPAPAAGAANQPNGQVAPPSRIRSDVQVMTPSTGEVPRESRSGVTNVPSLNQLSGDEAKGVRGR